MSNKSNLNPQVITEFDLHLFHEGTHYEIFNKLGAHPITFDGIIVVYFAVWSPNAKSVSVIGSFNNWDGGKHPMNRVSGSVIWELFIAGINPGEMYKYEIRTKSNDYLKKADPYAFYSELRPDTASIVCDLDSGYEWHDSECM